MCRFQRKGAHRLKNGGAHPKGCAPVCVAALDPKPENGQKVEALAAKPQKGWVNMEWIKRIARRILRAMRFTNSFMVPNLSAALPRAI